MTVSIKKKKSKDWIEMFVTVNVIHSTRIGVWLSRCAHIHVWIAFCYWLSFSNYFFRLLIHSRVLILFIRPNITIRNLPNARALRRIVSFTHSVIYLSYLFVFIWLVALSPQRVSKMIVNKNTSDCFNSDHPWSVLRIKYNYLQYSIPNYSYGTFYSP